MSSQVQHNGQLEEFPWEIVSLGAGKVPRIDLAAFCSRVNTMDREKGGRTLFEVDDVRTGSQGSPRLSGFCAVVESAVDAK